jgi:hypothetical protein
MPEISSLISIIVRFPIGMHCICGRYAEIIVRRVIIVRIIVRTFAVRSVVVEVRVEHYRPPSPVVILAVRAYAVDLEERRNFAYLLPEGASGFRPGPIVLQVAVVFCTGY